VSSAQPGLPLAGVRVLAIEQYGAGPFGSLHLADLGADVIKIETPDGGGDVGRAVLPWAESGDSLFFQSLNRNKRSLCLDLRNPAGRRVFEKLVSVSDAVYSSLRGDVPAKLGITYDALKHVNPRIVCCSLSGFGQTGPRRAQPGYDYMLQALAGWMSITGEPGAPPTKTGVSLVDFSGGVTAALALVAGVVGARDSGVGMDCDVSLYDVSIAMLNYLAAWHLNTGFIPKRTTHSAHPSLVPFQNYLAADTWIVIACPKEKFWRLLTIALGHPEWVDDPRYVSYATRYEHADELTADIEAVLATNTASEWLKILESHGVPCARVATVAEALADEQTIARDLIVEVEHPTWGTVRTVRTAARAGAGRQLNQRAPTVGEDTVEIMRELCNYGDEEHAQLRAAGAFGSVEQ